MKYLITLGALCVVLLTLSFPGGADALTRQYPVHGAIGGVEVKTLVDSPVARDLIQNPDAGLPYGMHWDCRSTGSLPDAASLRRISREYSVDTATTLLLRCMEQVPHIRYAQQLFLSELASRRMGDASQEEFMSARAQDYIILVVPGWGYKTSADETGADLAEPRKIMTSLGFETHLVNVEDNGSVESGAARLVEAITEHSDGGKRIILVSASSGGPTVAAALRDTTISSNPQLAGWLNICGVLNGSPVIDTFMPWPRSILLRAVAFFEGWKYRDLLSLSVTHSKPRYESFAPPRHLTVVNYIGIPLSGQVSEMGATFYNLLKKEGPNDGLTLILDALAPGYTIMAIGNDHFVNSDPEINLKTAALVPVLLRLIEGNEIIPGDSANRYFCSHAKGVRVLADL
jgi:hypothetical protein